MMGNLPSGGQFVFGNHLMLLAGFWERTVAMFKVAFFAVDLRCFKFVVIFLADCTTGCVDRYSSWNSIPRAVQYVLRR